jgi:carboxyl-terminal processing protease
VCFCFGFAWRDVRRGRPAWVAFVPVPSTSAPSPESVFKDAYSNILENYYKPVSTTDLIYAGMSGMVSSLGDPHTIFLAPQAAKEFQVDTEGKFVGIGARLEHDPMGAKVDTVFDDAPAYAVGLRSGDIITAVDGKSVAGDPVRDIVNLIRGKENTVVHLTVLKSKAQTTVQMQVVRRKILTPTVEYKYLADSKIGLIMIHQFASPTDDQFGVALDKLGQQPVNGLIIDLRDNPGGLLETDLEMLSRFVENKTVVTIKMRDAVDEYQRTDFGRKRDFPYPIVILMNADTASAAEIFAGVLHDYKLATLVGTHSYGKASVQNIVQMRDGASVKVTTGRYFLPTSGNIGRKVDEDGIYVSGGLQPDVKADLDPDDTSIEVDDPKSDTQLEKAIQVIQGKK